MNFLFQDISLAVEYDGAGKHNGQFGIDPLTALRSEFTHRQGMNRLIEQHRRMSKVLRPYPPHLRKAAGRAWREG
ncbi:hypothetical protein GCM10027580_20470 [Corynebacterium faecale]|uniref:hypothetical protein n=1 Tax=Corynebacterium faecale TaxID=1758466 RepID=UPI0025B29F67|nr:hypothetical protein [Corynebacterium faecale]